MNFDELYQVFQNPPAGFGTIPWWVWNGRMEFKELDRQLHLFKDKGIDGYMIWVRFGCEIEYLSRDYFQRVRFCAQRSAELGLEMWFFDDYAWPSGTAHNNVPRANAGHRQRVLSCFEFEVLPNQTLRLDFQPPSHLGDWPKPAAGFHWVGQPTATCNQAKAKVATEAYQPSGILAEWAVDDRRVERIIAVRMNDGRADPTTACQITEAMDGNRLEWTPPAGHWHVLVLLSRDYRQYIDVLNPQAVRSFIDHTHEKYKQWVGAYFGNTIKGFFLDEPRCLRFGLDKPQYDEPTIPFTTGFFTRLAESDIKDIDATMVSVFSNADKMYTDRRVRFWKTISQWYRQSYFQQLASWAADNSLEYMGDCFSEDPMILTAYGDYFATTSPLQRPGLDSLGLPLYDRPDLYKGPKFASSLAHAHGRPRCMAEGPGLLGYECDLEQLKRCTDWLYVLGVNQLVPNAFMYTISHEHYYEPPSYFYQWTLWPHYNYYDAYVRRLSFLLSQGHHIAPVAVLYPTATWMGNYNPMAPRGVYGGLQDEVIRGGSPELRFVAQLGNVLADALLSRAVDYDYIDHAMLNNANTHDRLLHVGQEDFQIIIVPAATVLHAQTWTRLQQFAQTIPILLIGPLPLQQLGCDGNEQAMVDTFSHLFDVPSSLLTDNSFDGPSNIQVFHDKARQWHWIRLAGDYDIETFEQTLIDTIDSVIDRPLKVCCKNREIMVIRRKIGDCHVIFTVNRSNQVQHATIQLQATGSVWRWNPATAERDLMPVQQHGQSLVIDHEYAPYESLLLVTDPAIHNDEPIATPTHANSKTLELPAKWEFELLGDNVLLLNQVAVDSQWSQRKPWKGGATYRYETTFDVAEVPDRLWLMMDYVQAYWRQDRLRITINDKNVSVEIRLDWDAELLGCNLHGLLRKGTNRLRIECDHADYPNLGPDLQCVNTIPPSVPKLRLLGRFRLSSAGLTSAPPHEVPLESWTQFGYPFYSGAACYRCDMELTSQWVDPTTELCFDSLACVAKVCVNKISVGTVAWRPWTIAVGPYLKHGLNRFEIAVTNTQSNLMYEQATESGILGPVRLCLK